MSVSVVVPLYARRAVGELVRQQPSRAQVFQRFGIDYCCRGDRPLDEACRKAGVDLETVCLDLDNCGEDPASARGDAGHEPSLTELLDDMIDRDHAYLSDELPQLVASIASLLSNDRRRYPELEELSRIFQVLDFEICAHMIKAEQVLFPMIRRLERDEAHQRSAQSEPGDLVEDVAAVMQSESNGIEMVLRRMRWLTRGYEAPAGAGEAYCRLMARLAHLEQELHRHLHLENNVLFPAAIQSEAQQLTLIGEEVFV
jgi:regulator of cell morphogenesis and NO signaling